MPDPLDRVSSALARRYAIEKELGSGGMGTVYLAVDRKHGRKVALKVLAPDLAMALGPERFLREIEIVSRLSHPHILPLHDSGHAAGVPYYVTPFVTGGSLDARLKREGRLPPAEAVRLTREVADALSYAHAQGVVHRDVKPANILLADDHALLADFGVAIATDAIETERITDSGMALGTRSHSSPEQAAGSRAVDARSDVYSLGCVLFELLVGPRGSGSPDGEQLLAERFTTTLPPVSSIVPGTPVWLDAVITRATATAPAERYQNATQFREALEKGAETVETMRPRALVMKRRLVPAVVVMSLALAGAALAAHYRRADENAKRVYVSVIENRTGDSTLDPLGDVAADYIARGLTATRLLEEVYDGRAEALIAGVNPRGGVGAALARARRLGAGTMLQGRYYLEGDSLHLETQLIGTRDGHLILAFEPAVGLRTRQGAVVELLRQRVMGGMGAIYGPRFEPWEAQAVPPSYEAYREFLTGLDAAWGFQFDIALAHYRRASDLDPTYPSPRAAAAVAFALGSECHSVDSISESLRQQVATLPPIEHGMLEWAVASCRFDEYGKVAAGMAVLGSAPRSVLFAILTNAGLQTLGRPREALAVIQRLDPASLSENPQRFYWTFLAMNYHALHDYQQELEAASRGIQAFPHDPPTLDGRIPALAGLGRMDEIRTHIPEWFPKGRLTSEADAGTSFASCTALEAGAHGDRMLRQELLEMAADWFDAHPAVDPLDDLHVPCLWHDLGAAFDAGRVAQAQATFERRARDDSANVTARAGLGALAARRGDRAEAERMEVWLSARPGPFALSGRARIALLLGDRDRAVELLREARSQGMDLAMFVHLDPDLQSLREYPPYTALFQSSE